MRKCVIASLLLFCLFSKTCYAQIAIKSSELKITEDESKKITELISKFTVIEFDLNNLNSYLKDNPIDAKVKFIISDNLTWDLTISENEIRSPDYKTVYKTRKSETVDGITSPCNTYAGFNGNNANQFLRLFINEEQINGIVSNGKGGFVAIKRISEILRTDKSDNRYIVYDLDDMKPIAGICGVQGDLISETVKSAQSQTRISSTEALSDCKFLEIATEADSTFLAWYGTVGASNDVILSALNLTDGLYYSTFGIRILVTYQRVLGIEYPYSYNTESVVLNQFKNYWNSYMTSIHRDAAFLFTKFDFISLTNAMGAAYTSSLGDVTKAYGVSGYGFGTDLSFIVAHELGHILGAPHPGSSVGSSTINTSSPDYIACCSTSASLMCPNNPAVFSFCSYSQASINSNLSSNGSSLTSTVDNFSILGRPVICTTRTYRPNVLGTPTVWSSSNPSLVSIDASTGVATRIGSGSGYVTITGIMTVCGTSYTRTKSIYFGVPSAITYLSNPLGPADNQICRNNDATGIQVTNPNQTTQDITSYTWTTTNWDSYHLTTAYGYGGSPIPSSLALYNIPTSGASSSTVTVVPNNNCGAGPSYSRGFLAVVCSGGSTLIAYPNPASDIITLEFDTENISTMPNQVLLYSDTSTKPIWSQNLKDGSSKSAFEDVNKIYINVRDFVPGTYYLHVVSSHNQKEITDVKRILIE